MTAPVAKIELNDKVAIVTGSSRGIGEAIAHTFAAAGAKVVLASRKREELERVQADIAKNGGEAVVMPCHTGDPEKVEALVKDAIAHYGKVDVLVNNAATNPYFGPMLEVEWGAWDKTFDVNLKGVFAASRAVARHLIERNAPGSIINTSSILGVRAGKFQGVYSMTKTAMISMTKTLAVELGSAGIRVNAICPGFIRTAFASVLVNDEDISGMLIGKTPLGRIGDPVDIAGLALFLASDAARFVTGAAYVADGGITLE